MNLVELQRAVFEVTRQPLTPSERMRPRLPDGRSVREIAQALIKPNVPALSSRRSRRGGEGGSSGGISWQHCSGWFLGFGFRRRR